MSPGGGRSLKSCDLAKVFGEIHVARGHSSRSCDLAKVIEGIHVTGGGGHEQGAQLH